MLFIAKNSVNRNFKTNTTKIASSQRKWQGKISDITEK